MTSVPICEQRILGERLVEVLFFDMGGRGEAQQRLDWAILSLEERTHAERFHFERDRRMFVACRATLRTVLAERIGAAASSLRFELGLRGKPFLADAGVSFNASHAGDWFACAVSAIHDRAPQAGIDIGVDIEAVHPLGGLDDMDMMARHFFAPAEVQRLGAIAEGERTQGFFECWTRKEAVIKATGEGVSRALDSFEVAFGPGVPPGLLRLDGHNDPGWPMYSFEPAANYVAALTAVYAGENLRRS